MTTLNLQDVAGTAAHAEQHRKTARVEKAAAKAKRERERAESGEPADLTLRCSAGHPLEPAKAARERDCDGCEEECEEGSTIHVCSRCDYDLCGSCVEKQEQLEGRQPVRRSIRDSKSPSTFTFAELPDRFRAPGKQSRGRSPRTPVKQYSDEEWQRLEAAAGDVEWLEEMGTFLQTRPHGRNSNTISFANARTVMRQMKVLVTGEGVRYKHWNRGIVFGAGRPVTLKTNCTAMFHEACAFEEKHGRDKGNGWLLRHPLTKMSCFQVYKMDQLDREEDKGSSKGGKNKMMNATTTEKKTTFSSPNRQRAPSSPSSSSSSSASTAPPPHMGKRRRGDSSWTKGAVVEVEFNDEGYLKAVVLNVYPNRTEVQYDVDGSKEKVEDETRIRSPTKKKKTKKKKNN
jgi:hypothetical protein